VLVDGLLQSRPTRLDASLLVVESGGQRGCGLCPPAGDLRASPQRLVDASDAVLVKGESPDGPWTTLARRAHRTVWPWRRGLLGLRDPGGTRRALELLTRRRVGLVTTIARPERLLSELAVRGILPEVHVRYADHDEPKIVGVGSVGRPGAVDVWLTTEKCSPKIGPLFDKRPVWTIEQRVELPDGLVEWVLEATALGADRRLRPSWARGEAPPQQCSGLREPW